MVSEPPKMHTLAALRSLINMQYRVFETMIKHAIARKSFKDTYTTALFRMQDRYTKVELNSE